MLDMTAIKFSNKVYRRVHSTIGVRTQLKAGDNPTPQDCDALKFACDLGCEIGPYDPDEKPGCHAMCNFMDKLCRDQP
jgi:hypothetical protein